MAIDQGTTSSRALIFDSQGRTVTSAQQEFQQHYPNPGWVEHDPEEIWSTTLKSAQKAMKEAESGGAGEVVCIGITNQRETTLCWERGTGRTVAPAIVWQDRRTADLCAELQARNLEEKINHRTGLTIDPYFSGTKLRWILRNVPEAQRLADSGQLAFGTVDTFLINRLTGGSVHVTDETNASRTMMYNIVEGVWDTEILELLGVPDSVLPEVQPSASAFGHTSPELFGRALPILGVSGDQQAAAFGQACWHAGMIKSTYGTGCFLLASTGEELIYSTNGLLSTVACRTGSEPQYAIEGSIFIAGAVSQWLRDELGLIEHVNEIAPLAGGMKDNTGVYLVPAFTGLGAPHWDPAARGAVFGLTRDSDRKVMVRAALESVAYQTHDLLTALKSDGLETGRIRVDGGMVSNDWFLQFLADTVNTPIDRPDTIESTARGAAFLAGLQAGVYESVETLETLWQADRTFGSQMSERDRNKNLSGWEKAVQTTLFRASLD